MTRVAPSPHALRLQPRALLPPIALPRDARLTVAFDATGLEPATRAALDAHPDLALAPFVPRGEGELPAGELVLEGPAEAVEALAREHPTLAALVEAWEAALSPPGPPRLMGVLNVTPDSFSDGGRFLDPDAAVEQGRRLRAEGATWVDVGGESTRPGAGTVPTEEELARVIPVVDALAAEGVDVSIDTRKAPVARAALDAGARMVNDVSAGTHDEDLLPLVAERGCPLVLMHAGGEPATMQHDPRYRDVVAEVASSLRERAAAAVAAGVDPARLVLDPGIGFGKRLEHNLSLLRRLPELRSLGAPLLVGVSRKSFIGRLSGAERPQDRVGGTAAAVTACVLGGAEILRVHDVGVMAEAVSVARALRDGAR